MSLRRYEDEIYDVLTTDFDLNTEVKNEDDRVILRANCSIDALEDEDILFKRNILYQRRLRAPRIMAANGQLAEVP